MAREFTWAPQQTLDEITNLVNPVLDLIVPFVPYLAVLAFGPGLLRALLQWKMQAAGKSFMTDDVDRRLRSVPLSVGMWGIFTMNSILVCLPGLAQTMAASEAGRATLEILTMGFGWFTLFGFLNVAVRYGLDRDVRKQLGKLGLLDMAIILTVLMPALGIMLYAWSTVRWASVWTGTVLWQSWVDAFTFNFSNTEAMAELPVFVKLYMILGPLAAAHVLYSRLLTHLLIPRVKLWQLSAITGGAHDDDVSVSEAAALMYGITAETKEPGHK